MIAWLVIILSVTLRRANTAAIANGILAPNQAEGGEVKKLGPYELNRVHCVDALEALPQLPDGCVDAVITDPPYGMKKEAWDNHIPNWMSLVFGKTSIATFCGVIGMRDYPTPDWIGAWVRQGSTQRNGRLRGFNNWEPILFYNIPSLLNDVISTPNYHDNLDHPTIKPIKLMIRLCELMPYADIILDPFAGSGTTGVAAVLLGRQFLGFEISPEYCEIANKRIEAARKGLTVKELEAGQQTLFEP